MFLWTLLVLGVMAVALIFHFSVDQSTKQRANDSWGQQKTFHGSPHVSPRLSTPPDVSSMFVEAKPTGTWGPSRNKNLLYPARG